MKITTYDSPDVSKPHCRKYCVFSGIQGKRDKCKFCGKSPSGESEKEEFYSEYDEIKTGKENLEKYF